jgi:hypothetical protein
LTQCSAGDDTGFCFNRAAFLGGVILDANEKAGACGSGLGILPELGRSARSRSFIGLLDIVVGRLSHEISGYIAMQHTQFNFVSRTLGALAVLVPLAGNLPVLAGTIAQPARPDPLLDGGPTSPCAMGAEYAAGSDANGAAVAPADVGARPVPVPDAIAIPLNQGRPGQGHRDGRFRSASRQPGSAPDSAYVSIDGRKLAPLLNPPACTNPAH